jgi:hypothetical protein
VRNELPGSSAQQACGAGGDGLVHGEQDVLDLTAAPSHASTPAAIAPT